MNELKGAFSKLGEEQIKENIRRIIMSYRYTWDIYTELIQNGVDAIIDKFGYENLKEGKIKLTFNTEKREIIIEDNGIGIKEEDISSIFVTGESLKRRDNRGKFGFMGYGFTFVAFQTEHLKIETKYQGKSCMKIYNDLYKVVFCDSDFPESVKNDSEFKLESSFESGTRITLRFPKEFITNEMCENNIEGAFSHAKHPVLLKYILKTKSALGLTDTVYEGEKELFNVSLIIDDEKIDFYPGYLTIREIVQELYPDEPKIYTIEEYEKQIKNYEHLDLSLQRDAKRCFLIDGVYKNISIGSRNPITVDIYVAMTSKKHLNTYEDTYFENVDDGVKGVVLNGIWLSIDGLPTGICLDPLNHGNFLPFTVIVNVSKDLRDELDSGRKGISTRRVEQIVDKVKDLIGDNNFTSYREFIYNVDTRPVSHNNPTRELDDSETKKHYDIKLIHQYFPPATEQDVISLFIELIKTGDLHGYFPRTISSYSIYDALFNYKTNFPEEILRSTDPLGISKPVKQEWRTIDREIVVEFKNRLKSLIEDIKSQTKNLSHIDLLVCWTVDFDKKSEYLKEFGIILRPVETQSNYYHGASYEIVGGGTNLSGAVPIIELKTIIEKKYRLKF